MKSIVVVLALLTGVNAHSASAWEHFSSGDGTAFEERWVATSAIESMSSNETLASDLNLGAKLHGDDGLFVWVSHASSEICKFSDWRLAVDKTVIRIKPKLGEDTKATALFPVDEAESVKLLKLFREGEKVAVRFHANCDNMFYLNYIGTATMTYSLNGSSAALEFLTNNSPELADNGPELREIVRAAAREASSFEDAFQAEMWLTDMSARLERQLPDPFERIALLTGVHFEATRVDLPPELILAIIEVESDFDKNAVSVDGEMGLMQVMPHWIEEIGTPEDNLLHVDTNLRYGCTILRFYYDKENGDLRRALARYDGNPGSRTYANKVIDKLATKWFQA